MSKEENKIKVSDDFVEIYKNFNVYDQVEKMKQLSKKELYLLLTICLDKHSDEDPVVKFNFLPFEKESRLVYDVQDDKEVGDKDLNELIKETSDKYIDTDVIVDSNGDKLPEPLTKVEVRDAKINIINR